MELSSKYKTSVQATGVAILGTDPSDRTARLYGTVLVENFLLGELPQDE